MKIRTQLIISTAVFVVVLLLISVSVVSTNQQLDRLSKQEQIANALGREANDISYLSAEYILHRGDLQRERWELAYASFSSDLSKFDPQTPEQQTLVANIQNNQQGLKEVFDNVVSMYETSSATSDLTEGSILQVSWSRMAVQAQGIVSDTTQLSRIIDLETQQTKQTANLLIFALMGAFVTFLFISSFLFSRRTLVAINDLQEGARIVGTGNLDYVIDESSDDEIGDLSRSFNRMTANLKVVTASKADLEQEATERKRAEEALRESENLLRTDLEAMNMLQKLGTLYIREGNLEPVFAKIVDTAIAITAADFGNIQLVDPVLSDLRIAAQRGFPDWWLDYWNTVSKGKGACGTALSRGERVIIEDIEQSPIFAGTPALEIQLRAGVRAVQSTPLMNREGKPLGMFSTYFKVPHRPDGRQLRLLDLLARQAADIIERSQSEDALLKKNADLSALNEELTAIEEKLHQNLKELSLREEDLSKALAEKEVLLSEIHHRVKNNLTAFISLLSLEGSTEETQTGRELKKDLQNRARSMALIHETLYRTHQFSSVDMNAYLTPLIDQIVKSYSLSQSIRSVVDAEGITLDLGRATPIGLIINELVTNSLKYAFPPEAIACRVNQNDPCTIGIQLIQEDGSYVMKVFDNGIGLPAGFDPLTAKSLGLKLVNFLARHQLRAKLEINTNNGTEFVFRFKERNHGT
jgi:two-component sensor histidine kinase/HAMP domain-containing protein